MTFQACQNDDELQGVAINNEYYTAVNEISVLKEDATQYIQEYVESDSLVIFNSNTPEEALPKIGDKIFIPVSEKVPYGFLGKVSSIKKGTTIEIFTENLPLDEVFEYLSVDETTSSEVQFDGIYDINGEPIEFEIVDTTEIDFNDPIEVSAKTRATEDFKFDWNWKNECLKFPVKLYEGKSGKDKIDISGMAYVGFRNFDFDIDIANKKLNYVNLNATPYVKIGLTSTVTTVSKLELSERIAQLRFRIIIPTPAGIPIIIPVTTYVYGTCGIKGELSAKLGLQYEYNCNCIATFKNGEWNSAAKHGGFNNKSPWTVGEFDVNGEIYSGTKIGLLVGLYSATTGIGFNIIPHFSIGAKAKLTSEDLLKSNSEVYLSLKAGSDVYCVAELFGKKLAKYSLKFPDFTLWSQTTYLLPNISDFDAVGASSAADISWHHDSFYFLSPMGVKTGTTIFEEDKKTEVHSYKPSPTSSNNEMYSYNVNATGLEAGKTYYAAPFAYWKDYKWYGEMKEFTTEAGYTFYWKCEGRDDSDYLYKVPFTFDLSRNSLFTKVFEQASYNGTAATRTFMCNYDATSKLFTGTIESVYAGGDHRIDGFSLYLSDDTGYVTNEKILDNGACWGAIRLVKDGVTFKAKARNVPQEILECDLGDTIE